MRHIHILLLLQIFIATLHAEAIVVDGKTSFKDILPSSKLYMDYSKNLDINAIKTLDTLFKPTAKKQLGFGYSPDFTVWVKFTLQNDTDKTIHKILEYDSPLTSNIRFYDPTQGYKVQQEGLYHIKEDRNTINPIFVIKLAPHERGTYYLELSSYVVTLIVKLNLWDQKHFFSKELKHQVILAMFFSAMLILAIYNLFIFFFTKDLSYLYYVLYIFGILIHHIFYIGIANVYLIPHSWMETIIGYASIIVGIPAFLLALFTKTFIRAEQYPKFNKILNIYLFVFPFLILLFILTDQFNVYRNIPSVIMLILLITLTIYAGFKKNKQAYFIIFGWVLFFVAGLLMYLSSAGILNVFDQFPYIVELALVIEATVLSIALAHRIRQLQFEKENAQHKLLLLRENEKERLELQVTEKTKNLATALDEKELLLKELNHRVKNNMQTIVSLIRLQLDKIQEPELREVLITIQNRINSMSHLHELLYKENDISEINAYHYFERLVSEIKQSYDHDINIHFDIQTDLKIEHAIYCGLIVNELVTNTYKYAYNENVGDIHIQLIKQEDLYYLNVDDNGKGYDQSSIQDSLGLILVKTLAKKQLRGEITINSNNGVHVAITWRA